MLAAAALGLAGCGGGGGGGAGSPGDDGQASAPTGDVPPASGVFGGGQGKILYVDDDQANVVKELDLSTRRIRTIAEIPRRGSYAILGGVKRAQDGSILVTDYEITKASSVYLFGSDGSLRKTFAFSTWLPQGATLSPDGRSIAYVNSRMVQPEGEWFHRPVVEVTIIDVLSGRETVGTLLGLDDPTPDKGALAVATLTAWASDSTLYVLVPNRLYRVDRASAKPTRIHDMPSHAGRTLIVSPTDREIWFEANQGSPYGSCLWSVDVSSGQARQRSVRSVRGRQYCPAFSPDGQWLQQGRLGQYVPVEYSEIHAMRLTEAPVDAENLATAMLDSGGKRLVARHQMVWF